MNVLVRSEHGHHFAMLGLELSFSRVSTKMEEKDLVIYMESRVAPRLAHKGDGHNKFLEQIMVWLDIKAPRYWWQQFDTYRIGTSKQSESTMHTILQRPLDQRDFQYAVPETLLSHLNTLIKNGKMEQVKNDLPEGYLQRRIVCTNYLTLQRMFRQRETHKLLEWRLFCVEVLRQLRKPEYIKQENTNEHS